MTRGISNNGGILVCWLTLGGAVAMSANAADTRATRATAPPAPPAPVFKAVRPVLPPAAKPDYAIGLGSQQEFENTALAWTFRVENRGAGAPAGQGSGTPGLGAKSASLVISVGNPCPKPNYWITLASIPLPPLKPGTSIKVPIMPYRMPGEYAGRGCQFRAEIKGPVNDANLSNNVMHMFTKTALLPDLVVVFGDYKGGPGGGLDVKNIGKAAAGPSKFRFECATKDPKTSCGAPHEQHKWQVVLDVPVPALNPGQSFTVRKSTPGGTGGPPKGVTWKATADHAISVTESNETNNVKIGGQ